jgi:hypothetical protein
MSLIGGPPCKTRATRLQIHFMPTFTALVHLGQALPAVIAPVLTGLAAPNARVEEWLAEVASSRPGGQVVVPRPSDV